MDKISKEYGAKGYTNFNELLNDEELDAVSIVLPDNMHADAVKAAAFNNKHILLEKPLATNLEDGKAILNHTKATNKIFMVGHLLRFDPRFSKARRVITQGLLGDLIHLYFRRNSPISGALRYKNYADLHMHVMIHDLDIANWLIGSKASKVIEKNRQVRLRQYNISDSIFALIEFENGTLACFEACWALPENSPMEIDDRVEIVGTKGVFYIQPCGEGNQMVTQEKIIQPDSRHWPEINGEPGGCLHMEIFHFLNCIFGKQKLTIHPSEAFDALVLAEAIERSLREKREIQLY